MVFDTQTNQVTFSPQEGPQTAACASAADILLFGGGAGGGKTYLGSILEPLRHIKNSNMKCLVFRRMHTEITTPGGLWSELLKFLTPIGAKFTQSPHHKVKIPSGPEIHVRGMQYETDVYHYQGTQVSYIFFDELTHFTEKQFTYMFSRTRSVDSGVSGYIRASCNPDVTSWVREWVDWWIDPVSGEAIVERIGVLRWFNMGDDDKPVWFNSKEEAKKAYPDRDAKSFTFIPSNIFDNKILMEKDPTYLTSLQNLPLVERQRLLHSNWNSKPAAGMYFRKEMFEFIEPGDVPNNVWNKWRCWDLASTEKIPGNDPDFTIGLKASMDQDGETIYLEHAVIMQKSSANVKKAVLNSATGDGPEVFIYIPQDPGQAGKAQVAEFSRLLLGFRVESDTVSGDKIVRSGGASSASENGHVKIVRGPWNTEFLRQLEVFFTKNEHDDCVDAFSDIIRKMGETIRASLTEDAEKPDNTIAPSLGTKQTLW